MAHFRVIVILALRNLRRHVRRTLLTSAAMIIGGAMLMFALSLGDGTHEQWIDSGVRMGSGHITVEHPEYRLSRRIEDRLPDTARRAAAQALASSGLAERVVTVSAKLVVSGLASSAAGARPVQIMGVDADAESAFSIADDQLVEGRYLEQDDRLAAYVGIGLAQSLDLRLGSRFVVTAQDAQKEIAGQLLRVVGMFRTGVPEIDEAVIHIPIATAGEWLASGHDVTNVSIMVADSAAVLPVARALRGALSDPIASGSVTVMGWREAMPELSAAVTIDDLGNYLVFGILFIVIGFGIVNTVLMSVMHRHREFGVLQALGLTSSQTGVVVLVEGLVQTVVSGAIGVALGVSLTWYFFGDGLDYSVFIQDEMTFGGVVIDPLIFPLFRTSRIVQVVVFILGIGAVASVYPAFRAAHIDVTEAMKFDR